MDYEAWRCMHEKEGQNLFCPDEGCPKHLGCARDHGWKPGQPSADYCWSKSNPPLARAALLCSACGGDKHLRHGSPWHSAPICNPCFKVWYDPDENIDMTDPAQVGALSLKLKAAGKYPWTGRFAP